MKKLKPGIYKLMPDGTIVPAKFIEVSKGKYRAVPNKPALPPGDAK